MNAIAGVIIVLIIVVFSGYVIAALRGMVKEDRMIDDNEFSLGQEDRIVVIEDVANNNDQEENEE